MTETLEERVAQILTAVDFGTTDDEWASVARRIIAMCREVNRCADCKHFECKATGMKPDPPPMPYGHCRRWLEGYHYSCDSLGLNEAWVEDDEGWGNVIGPDFGCVLWEPLR